MKPENLYADLLVAPFRVFGGKKVHLVEADASQRWQGSAAICGSFHEWAASGRGEICEDCRRIARVLLAPKGNP